jgi:TolA-binding protein
VVDGIALGERVTAATPNYRSYHCGPSDDFAGATRCERTQELHGAAGRLTVVHTLIHTGDGTAIYVMANAAPVRLSKTTVADEINSLSRAIGERPAHVEYNRSNPAGVIAVWGQVKLDAVQGDAIDALSKGQSPHLGVLIDFAGDLQYSAQHGLPVYRMIGGSGYVYAASFHADGLGHRHYVALDAPRLAVSRFQMTMDAILQRDRALASDDYSLWPVVAEATRNLARDTSVTIANAAVDRIFDGARSDKLRSHVWAMLPLGSIDRLKQGEYSRLDNYGPQTKYPQVRRDMQNFLAAHPADRFLEFAYFTVGDFDGALAANSNSVIGDVLHYAKGYSILQSLMQDTLTVLRAHVARTTPPGVRDELDGFAKESPDTSYHVSGIMSLFDHYPDLRGGKPLGQTVANFNERTAAAQRQFEAVLRHPSGPMADDAAFMLGWLALQQGGQDRALSYFAQALIVGNGDYAPAALRQIVGILQRLPAREQMSTVQSNAAFARQPALWYAAARSAYREFDYALAIDVAQRALQALKVPVDQLPVTTDPDRIEAALQRINARLSEDPNAEELPYLIQASKEFLQYQDYLTHAGSEPAEAFAERARTIIIKYSMLHDPSQQPAHPVPERHKDLRQALHLIAMTLQAAPRQAPYTRLREWLYYRRVRVLAVFDPAAMPGAIAAMKQEFPNSILMNDALAEQIFADGITLKNPDAAEAVFRKLLQQYPNGNAVDNAYSWMEIALRCAGRLQEAQAINEQIIQRFPMTRHAAYARVRLAHPERDVDPENCGW